MENQLRIHSNLTIEDMMYNHNIDKKKTCYPIQFQRYNFESNKSPPPTSLIFLRL